MDFRYYVIQTSGDLSIKLHGEFNKEEAQDKADLIEGEDFDDNALVVSKEQLVRLKNLLNKNFSL